METDRDIKIDEIKRNVNDSYNLILEVLKYEDEYTYEFIEKLQECTDLLLQIKRKLR